MAAASCSFSPASSSLPLTTTNVEPPSSMLSLPYPFFFTPNASSKKSPRLRISHRTAVLRKLSFRVLAGSGVDNNAEACPELGPSLSTSSPRAKFVSNVSQKEMTTMDIKLPRRSLMVQFTCNLCGERTQKLVNRLAYERGTVFVQCAGCLQHHKLVDNLGLVVEYDLREDINVDSKADQV